jgi:hypothetical protein
MSERVQSVLMGVRLKRMEQPLYRQELAPCELLLFGPIGKTLRRQHCESLEEIAITLMVSLARLVVDVL